MWFPYAWKWYKITKNQESLIVYYSFNSKCSITFIENVKPYSIDE